MSQVSKVHIWLEATRPKTLPAAITPVLLGTAAAWADGGFDWRAASICLAFALLVQIGTNFANDYLDGIKGTDTEERIGPRRAVASGLVAPQTMKRATFFVLALAFCVGLGLIPFGGWWLLAVGVASVLAAWGYTGGPYPLAYNGLGDVFVILFFGFIAVGCTYYVQVGRVTPDVLLLGLGCGLLVNNILLVNNYRDVAEDLAAGKNTLVVRFGRGFALKCYMLASLIAGGVALWFSWRGFGAWVLLAVLPSGFSWMQVRRLKAAQTPLDFLAALKSAGLVVAAYGLLFSVGLFLG